MGPGLVAALKGIAVEIANGSLDESPNREEVSTMVGGGSG